MRKKELKKMREKDVSELEKETRSLCLEAIRARTLMFSSPGDVHKSRKLRVDIAQIKTIIAEKQNKQ